MSIGAPVIGILDNPPTLGCTAIFHHHRLGIIAGIGLQTVGAVGVLNDSEPLGIHNPAGRCLGPDLDDGVVLGRLVGDFHSRPCGAHGNQRIVPGGGIELDFKLLALAAVEAALGQIRPVCAARGVQVFPALKPSEVETDIPLRTAI